MLLGEGASMIHHLSTARIVRMSFLNISNVCVELHVRFDKIKPIIDIGVSTLVSNSSRHETETEQFYINDEAATIECPIP